ncbi:MAG: MBL fold metallo-hydrolase [Verrucomicrobia bacterium]|nr:MBL fold metallo-hydrolase [Verrucomicrobiota bacterium]
MLNGFEIVQWRVADWRSFPLVEGETVLWWLGQAGFAVRHGNRKFLIDPYLSDSLARKYAGTKYPHLRMMPPPVAPEQVADIDWVFCTHSHTDHMDPDTLSVIARNPGCCFIVPRAVVDHAVKIAGLEPDRVITVDAGETLELGGGISVAVVPSAHEDLKVNGRGEHFYVGYVIRLNGLSFYHAGDCVPYEGHRRWLSGVGPVDLALLAANGRDAERTAGGIPGNFTIDEVLELAAECSFPQVIVHHFGMFDFNTVDPQLLWRKIKAAGQELNVIVPIVNQAYHWRIRGFAHGEPQHVARMVPPLRSMQEST